MANFRDTRTPESRCPYCDYKFDAAMSVNPDKPGATPKPGHLSICISCASLLVFNDDLTVRAPLPGEKEQAIKEQPGLEETLNRAQQAVRSLDRRKLGEGNEAPESTTPEPSS